jgi:hypothetical protein
MPLPKVRPIFATQFRSKFGGKVAQIIIDAGVDIGVDCHCEPTRFRVQIPARTAAPEIYFVARIMMSWSKLQASSRSARSYFEVLNQIKSCCI